MLDNREARLHIAQESKRKRDNPEPKKILKIVDHTPQTVDLASRSGAAGNDVWGLAAAVSGYQMELWHRVRALEEVDGFG